MNLGAESGARHSKDTDASVRLDCVVLKGVTVLGRRGVASGVFLRFVPTPTRAKGAVSSAGGTAGVALKTLEVLPARVDGLETRCTGLTGVKRGCEVEVEKNCPFMADADDKKMKPLCHPQ